MLSFLSNGISFVAQMASRRRWMKPVSLMVLVAFSVFVFCQEADAAPGGQFVKQLLSSKFGRIGGFFVGGLLVVACILLLPLIIYITYKEKAGIRKTKKDLAVLAATHGQFEWQNIRNRVKQAVQKIADVWASGDLSSVSSFMTAEYLASQQQLLNRWVDEGKQIVYRLGKISKIEPLAVGVEDEATHSWIRVLVTVDCVDYMRDKHTLEVVKGEVGTTTGFESVWNFIHQNGEWLLHGIEPGSTSLSWATMKNQVDTSYLDQLRGTARPQVRDATKPAVPGRAGARSQMSALDSPANDSAAQPKKRLVRKPASDQDQ